MNKPVVILVVLLLLGLGSTAHAVDLDAGWYVKLGTVSVASPWGWGGIEGLLVTNWNPVAGMGISGPFEVVTSVGDTWTQRVITVPRNVNGVAPGTSVYIWGEFAETVDYPVVELVPRWETNYDAAKMRLELLMYKESDGYVLLWSQALSDMHNGWGNVLTGTQHLPVGYEPVFRVTVVPEPMSITSIAFAFATLAMARRRPR